MRARTRLVIGFAGIAIAAASALPAAAASHQAGHHVSHSSVVTKKFPIRLTPHKNVKTGQTINAVGHHAKANTSYVCVLIIDKGADYAVDLGSYKPVKSNKSGVVRCSQKFTAYSAKDLSGTNRHCPLTKADSKAGFSCGLAISTVNMKSGNRAIFTAKASK